jgi:hypothetical protein
VIEWTNGKILELTALLRGAGVVVAVFMVVYAYIKHRSLVAVLVAAITAGIFLWTINNTDWWQQRVDEESAPVPAVVEVATAPGELSGAGGWLGDGSRVV